MNQYKNLIVVMMCMIISPILSSSQSNLEEVDMKNRVSQIIYSVEDYSFNPIVNGFTKEPALDNTDGVADLNDKAWRVRLLAIRDLVKLGEEAVPEIIKLLEHDDPHVRHVASYVLGLWQTDESEKALINLVEKEKDPVVRSQVVISLGRLNSQDSLPALEKLAENDPSRDVQHQCDLSIYRIKNYQGNDQAEIEKLRESYATLDESKFNQIQEGKPAVDFTLQDTDGKKWHLSDFKGKQHVVLIWIFADWCPVCHNEFRELIELKEEYEKQNIQVFTIECHDMYRSRVMVGEEYQPEYWFSKESPQGLYDGKIWWPHLVDRAGAVGAMYGVQPMEFTVHSEWINRPSTVIIDKEGIVRLAYYGTYWGDRPSIHETVEMIESGDFDFEHPKRLKP